MQAAAGSGSVISGRADLHQVVVGGFSMGACEAINAVGQRKLIPVLKLPGFSA